MPKVWKSFCVPTRESWLILAALAGCAGPTDEEGEEEPSAATGALPLDPVSAERSVNSEDYTGVATRDGTGQEDETRDMDGLVLGPDRTFLGWFGSTSGSYSGRILGGGVVIDAVQVRSGDYVNAIRFHYYVPSRPDNLYVGERTYWTSWVGPTDRGTLRPSFWCPGAMGLTGYDAFLDGPNPGSRTRTMRFACDYVHVESRSPFSQDHSPYYGNGSGSNVLIAYPRCPEDALMTDFTLRSDSSSIKGIEGICQSKW